MAALHVHPWVLFFVLSCLVSGDYTTSIGPAQASSGAQSELRHEPAGRDCGSHELDTQEKQPRRLHS